MKLSFEDYLKKENLSQHTISVYLWTVDYFISNYKDFNTENLHAYKGYLMEFFKPKTVNLGWIFYILYLQNKTPAGQKGRYRVCTKKIIHRTSRL